MREKGQLEQSPTHLEENPRGSAKIQGRVPKPSTGMHEAKPRRNWDRDLAWGHLAPSGLSFLFI